ncbi:magnesium transporter [Paenibacillus senegalensis]|uniref:magnesium transporter n=1 Tax=Paenibacillus senegalensis TaxID=1465766 RepID=UPI0002891B62|nr:magnesium transporter [Paenibacillus senegalensis]
MVSQMTEEQWVEQLIKTLDHGDQPAFQETIDELQPYDWGVMYQELPESHRAKFLSYMTLEQTALLLQELDSKSQLQVLQKLGIEKSSAIMDLMQNDDLADLLSQLSDEEIEEFLGLMKEEEKQTVQNLMTYPPESAGGIMTNRYVWIRRHYTVKETIEKLKAFAELAENLYYLYVLDEEKKLVGVVSYRDLLLAEAEDVVESFMYTRVISVNAHEDQEAVARIIERYDFLSVPVVDDEQKLIGIITVDDIIDVFIQEANEDIGRLSASGKTIDFDTGAFTASFRRLPWLILLLFLGLISGSIISGFEETLAQVVALTFFMPMIAGMTGNTGTQSLAVVVRGLVSHDLDKKVVTKLVLRESGVGLIIGTTCGVLIAAIAYLWLGSPVLGLVVGLSLFLTLIIGTLAGTVIPLLLYRLKVDPAVASGPLITTLNDIFSLTVYFGTATMFLSYLT